MNFRILLALPILMTLTARAPALQTPAALAICDACVTESHFSNHALLVPLPYQTVYVSNRTETLKFERRISRDESMFGSPRLEIEVIPVTINTAVRTALDDLIDLSQRDEATIPRDLLETPRNSVVGDLQNGRLDTAFLQDLATFMNSEGYGGRPSDFDVSGGISIGFISVNAAEKDNLRTKPLLIKVTYSDGSLVQIRIDADLARWLDVSIKDAAGNDIPVEVPTNVFSDVKIIDGRELIFDPSNPGFVENFLDALRTRPTFLVCETRILSDGHIVVSCRSTP